MTSVVLIVCMLVATAPSVAADASELSSSAQQMLERHPGLKAHVENGQLRSVYGRPIATGQTAVESAERLRVAEAHVWGVAPDDLAPVAAFDASRTTLPLGYDKDTGLYRFTLVYYTQFVDDIPVYESELRVLVRNEADYPAVMAKSTLRDVTALNMPGVAEVDVERGYAAALDSEPRITDLGVARQVVFAGTADRLAAPRLGFEFIASVEGHPDEWRFVTDAVTGEVLHKVNRIQHVDVEGRVEGLATTGVGAEHCGFVFTQRLPYALVSIDGGNSAYADASGDFVIPNAGSTDVTVRSTLEGEWFEVFNFQGSESTVTQVVTPPGPALSLRHNSPNAEFTRAEVNGYYNANLVRDWVLEQHPNYPEVWNYAQFPVTVNRNDGYCPQNAWYSPGERSINFCSQTTQYPNTAWSSVIFHEYGHHIVEAGGSGQGQYGEGMGDVISVLMQDDPGLGYGFYGTDVSDCATPLRNADNTMQYPCTSTIHTCGQLISGCVWDARNELVVTNPTTYIDILSYLAINAVPLHSGDTITPQITIDYLTLDDDDATIDNGTPHYNELCAGFALHNMDCPPLSSFYFDYPTGRPESVTPEQPTVFIVNTVPVAGDAVPGSGTLSYRIGGGGGFTNVPMVEVLPNEYEATLPGVPCGETIEYYFSATAQGGGTITDPADAPNTVFSALSASGLIVVASYDFETNPGFTASGSATDGQWDRGVPVNCNRGDPGTDYDGSGQCWLTDNSAASSCNSDVDGGTATLTSNVFDLTGLNSPQLTYARWYDNTAGGAPNADTFTVQISDNGGGSWTTLETVGPTGAEAGGGWYEKTFAVTDFVSATSQVVVRFNASDLATGSVVEAAIDALSIVDVDCEPAEAPPSVTAEPEDATVCDGETANFSVGNAGTPPFTYQWRKDGAPISGAESSSYSVVDATTADVGAYSVEITNVFGSTISADAMLAIVTVAECDDVNACTADSCAVGACVNTSTTPAGQCCDPTAGDLTPIDDGDACTSDTCNPDGTVDHPDNYDPGTQCCNSTTGAVLPIDDGNACTDDACAADGSVDHLDNFDVGTECCNPADGAIASIDDGTDCTADSCDAGTGAVTHVAVAPQATDEAPRSVAVVPDACTGTVAIRVTSPDHTCLDMYVDAGGFLTDTPVFLTPAVWATVHVRGEEIIPESTYTMSVETPGGATSDVSSASTYLWGDVDNSGLVNFVDINLIVQAFQGEFANVSLEAADLEPCIPNEDVNFSDIGQGVAAFQQAPYSDTGCQMPCP